MTDENDTLEKLLPRGTLSPAEVMDGLFDDPHYYGGVFGAVIAAAASKFGDEATVRRLLTAMLQKFDDNLVVKVLSEMSVGSAKAVQAYIADIERHRIWCDELDQAWAVDDSGMRRVLPEVIAAAEARITKELGKLAKDGPKNDA